MDTWSDALDTSTFQTTRTANQGSLTTISHAAYISAASSQVGYPQQYQQQQKKQQQQRQQQNHFDVDPMMHISAATFGTSTGHDQGSKEVIVESPLVFYPADSVNGAKTRFTPANSTTMDVNITTVSTGPGMGSTAPLLIQQAVMLDPFSMPSSITFPEQRVAARAEPSFSTTKPYVARDKQVQDETDRNHARSQLEVNCLSSQESGLELVWNDMPATLGLDEWIAYVGAQMIAL
ncbi:hypothetical protein BGZ65_000090, partial [Modicella reniformis]